MVCGNGNAYIMYISLVIVVLYIFLGGGGMKNQELPPPEDPRDWFGAQLLCEGIIGVQSHSF